MPASSDGIAAVVLAAGGGTRLGGGKLLLPWRGKSLLGHVVALVAELGLVRPPIVVIGHDAEHVGRVIRKECDAMRTAIRIVENPRWREGQSTSLKCGVECAAASGCEELSGVMVLLGDQPRVRSETLRLLAQSHCDAVARDATHPATAPVCSGRRGNPVILSPLLFPKITQLTGDRGAREILALLGEKMLGVPVDDPGIFGDVDTPEEYMSLQDE
jgi:Uncharacterized MobA-related protein